MFFISWVNCSCVVDSSFWNLACSVPCKRIIVCFALIFSFVCYIPPSSSYRELTAELQILFPIECGDLKNQRCPDVNNDTLCIMYVWYTYIWPTCIFSSRLLSWCAALVSEDVAGAVTVWGTAPWLCGEETITTCLFNTAYRLLQYKVNASDLSQSSMYAICYCILKHSVLVLVIGNIHN